MNTKPTTEELGELLIRLTVTADNCIPSEGASNGQLAAAESLIAESWAMIDRIKHANIAAATEAGMAHMGVHPNTDTAACNNTVPTDAEQNAADKVMWRVAFEKCFYYDVEVEAASEEEAEAKAMEVINGTPDIEQFYRAQGDLELCEYETEVV